MDEEIHAAIARLRPQVREIEDAKRAEQERIEAARREDEALGRAAGRKWTLEYATAEQLLKLPTRNDPHNALRPTGLHEELSTQTWHAFQVPEDRLSSKAFQEGFDRGVFDTWSEIKPHL
jgi:hypothetical protein